MFKTCRLDFSEAKTSINLNIKLSLSVSTTFKSRGHYILYEHIDKSVKN